jgi:hypothetical protein
VTFKEVMDQAMTWLQKDQRISYRALKRQFALEDDALDDLKLELIEVKRVAVDHDGLMLVWTGASSVTEPDTRSQAEAERQLYTVLPAVLALLRREQRVTYRSLRAVFGVDEVCLHAVRDELCFRQLAREERGQGLVWTGEAEPPAASALRPAPDTTVALAAASPRPPLPPSAERRPLPGLPAVPEREVSPLARRVMLQSVSVPLQDGVRFFPPPYPHLHGLALRPSSLPFKRSDTGLPRSTRLTGSA